MMVGCSGETFAGFPIGQNLIIDPLAPNTSFDLGVNFWENDNFDTVVHVTCRWEYYTPSPIPTPSNYNDYSIFSYSFHRQKISDNNTMVRRNENTGYSTRTIDLTISSSNKITKGSTIHTPIITGVFITKTKKPISWNA